MTSWRDEIIARRNAATPGPWTWDGWKTEEGTRYQHIMAIGKDNPSIGFGIANTYHMDAVRDYLEPRHGNHNNAEFIANAPTDIDMLLHALEVAEEALKRIEKGHDFCWQEVEASEALTKIHRGEFTK